MREREIDRFHPLEIVIIQCVLSRDDPIRRHTEMSAQHGNGGIQYGQSGYALFATKRFEF